MTTWQLSGLSAVLAVCLSLGVTALLFAVALNIVASALEKLAGLALIHEEVKYKAIRRKELEARTGH